MAPDEFAGKVVFVTGATSGIGRGFRRGRCGGDRRWPECCRGCRDRALGDGGRRRLFFEPMNLTANRRSSPRSNARQRGPVGLTVRSTAPGSIRALRFSDAGAPVTAEGLRAMMPLGRILSPEDVAASIVFLCSTKAANITGAALAVDGGFVLG